MRLVEQQAECEEEHGCAFGFTSAATPMLLGVSPAKVAWGGNLTALFAADSLTPFSGNVCRHISRQSLPSCSLSMTLGSKILHVQRYCKPRPSTEQLQQS